MKKVAKIRVYLNKSQESKANDILYKCHSIHNLYIYIYIYIEYEIKFYTEYKQQLSGYDFAKIFTKLKKTDKYSYYQDVSSKALKDAIMNAEKSIKSSLDQKKHPKFRSRKRNPVSSYFFIKDNIIFDIGKPNKIKIPILGEVRIRERSYLPDIDKVTSGRVIKKNGKFYLSFNYETEIDDCKRSIPGIGIDLGIKSYISIYCEGLNKSFQEESYIKYDNYIKVNDKIKRIQEVISHKAEINYGRLLNSYYDKHGEEPCEKFKKYYERRKLPHF